MIKFRYFTIWPESPFFQVIFQGYLPSKISSTSAKNKLFHTFRICPGLCSCHLLPGEFSLTRKIQTKCYPMITAPDTILPIRLSLRGCIWNLSAGTQHKNVKWMNGWLIDDTSPNERGQNHLYLLYLPFQSPLEIQLCWEVGLTLEDWLDIYSF